MIIIRSALKANEPKKIVHDILPRRQLTRVLCIIGEHDDIVWLVSEAICIYPSTGQQSREQMV
jgi:hypothetical protein